MSIKSVFPLLVVILCITASVNAQLPQFPPIQFPFPNPFQPSPGMPGMPDLTKCWSTVMDLPGCLAEIRQAVMTGKIWTVGPACCKAFLDAEANCTPNLPFNPFFPPMLKQQCMKNAAPPTTAL
ncbi:hypothetical protein CARUB_v10002606mg [Capsella rubella]|uniref:Prolamin-like domain-containing protein n=1 Tax=Capsella rubella TaxID=81985 RepID=R0FJ36_9BRAS|nr:uncharacterized protein LOC17884361 [Capsella rubella]EOA22066.1 hypothetical protein CARUB_v10002606mg [Capsella rubella]